MKRLIQNWTVALLFATTVGGMAMTVVTPQTTFAACEERLLTFPTWYQGLVDDKTSCQIKAPSSDKDGLSTFIWTIALNVIEMILQLVGYIAAGFIIVGGYKYMISAGSPDGMVKARKTITNAIVGLLISIFSVAIVNVISAAV